MPPFKKIKYNKTKHCLTNCFVEDVYIRFKMKSTWSEISSHRD